MIWFYKPPIRQALGSVLFENQRLTVLHCPLFSRRSLTRRIQSTSINEFLSHDPDQLDFSPRYMDFVRLVALCDVTNPLLPKAVFPERLPGCQVLFGIGMGHCRGCHGAPFAVHEQ